MASTLRSLAALSALTLATAASEVCPGDINLEGYGRVSIVPTGWDNMTVSELGHIVPHMSGRAYFADRCNAGFYDNNDYLALNLLGKTFRYTTDISGANCGCNVALYLTAMRQNTHESECHDYYCDANNVCGESCAEIDIQEANMYAWHSTLHAATDHSGEGKGLGGGGSMWNGPRDWSQDDYGVGGRCIDTLQPFDVAVSFPVDEEGMLTSMDVTLTQPGKNCPLSLSVGKYKKMEELSQALAAGMTPIVSYWSAPDMLWLDGRGQDKRGPCAEDHPSTCGESVRLYDFVIEDIAPEAPTRPAPVVTIPEPVVQLTPEPLPTPEMHPLAVDIFSSTAAPSSPGAGSVFGGAAASIEEMPSVSGPAHGVCHKYMKDIGCDWTHTFSCPGQRFGSKGKARDEGSLGYKCCCHYELWMNIEHAQTDDDEELQLCTASYGTDLGGQNCCGQPGFVNSMDKICPEDRPTCVGYEQGLVWGSCQAARPWQQCGGLKDGKPWWGPTTCTSGYVCKSWKDNYSQCIRDSNLFIMKAAINGVALSLERRPLAVQIMLVAGLLAAAAVVLVAARRARASSLQPSGGAHMLLDLEEVTDASDVNDV